MTKPGVVSPALAERRQGVCGCFVLPLFFCSQHVHVHVLPRKPGDFEENDEIYSQV